MIAWTSDELNKIGTADELEIAPLRRDGTLRNPVTIWVVRLGDELYVRSVNGRTAAWFRGVQVRHEGRIWAGGVEKDVTFAEESDPDINDQIDAAYRTKYRRYPQYVNPIVVPEARAATIKLLPRATGAWFNNHSVLETSTCPTTLEERAHRHRLQAAEKRRRAFVLLISRGSRGTQPRNQGLVVWRVGCGGRLNH